MKVEKWMHHLTYASAIILCLFLFPAFSLCSLHHALLAIVGFFFTYKAVKEKTFHFSASSWALVALVLISILSVIANSESIAKPMSNIAKLKYFILPLLGISAYRAWFENSFDQKKVKWAINILVISTTIATLSGLYAYFFVFNPLRFKEACHATRTCGMYGMYMTYGYGIPFFVILLLGLILKHKEVKAYLSPKLSIPAFVINFVSFILSFARGALLGFLIGLPFFYCKQRRKVFVGLVIAGLVAVGLSYQFIPKVRGLVHDSDRMNSADTRFSQYAAALKAAEEKPWLGLGYRNFEPNVKAIKAKYDLPHKDFAGHAHSNFFEHLASTGWLGLIALVMFHLLWFVESYRRNDWVGAMMMPFIVSIFISGQFQYTLGDGENLYLIMMVYMLSQVRTKSA